MKVLFWYLGSMLLIVFDLIKKWGQYLSPLANWPTVRDDGARNSNWDMYVTFPLPQLRNHDRRGRIL